MAGQVGVDERSKQISRWSEIAAERIVAACDSVRYMAGKLGVPREDVDIALLGAISVGQVMLSQSLDCDPMEMVQAAIARVERDLQEKAALEALAPKS